MQDQTRWRDKSWLITGASAGMGKALAEAVLAGGGRVIATMRDVSRASQACRDAGRDRCLLVELDITRPDQVREAMAQADRAFGGFDVLVNSAGYGFFGGVEEASDAEIRVQFETNFFGAVDVVRQALPIMRRRGGGFIVNLTSLAGLVGSAGGAFYAASKFALEGFSEALRDELTPFGIGVMIVEPGPLRTEFLNRSSRRAALRMPEYANVAARIDWIESLEGTQPGDPFRCAKAIITAMEMPDSPQRLLLGRAAAAFAHDIHRTRAAEVASWSDLAATADFPADDVGAKDA